MLVPTHRWVVDDEVHGSRMQTRAVRINLRGLFGENPASGVVVPDGLDLDRVVEGLTYGWYDGARGGHLAVVNYKIPFADPYITPLDVRGQVVSSRYRRTGR